MKVPNNNFNILVQALDKNNNGQMDELTVADQALMTKVDLDKNNQISDKELLAALTSDVVQIKGSTIVEHKEFSGQVNNQQRLNHINQKSAQATFLGVGKLSKQYDGQSDRDYKATVFAKNEQLSEKIGELREALYEIRTEASLEEDGSSLHQIHRKAEIALDLLNEGILQRPYPSKYDDLYEQLADYSRLEHTFTSLQSTLKDIENMSDYVSLSRSIQAANSMITKAFSNIEAIQEGEQTQEPVRVKNNLLNEADHNYKMRNATGRKGFAIGSIIGGAIGAGVGFFQFGKTPKSAYIGAGTGVAIAGSLGAVIGSQTKVMQSNNLREVADDFAQNWSTPERAQQYKQVIFEQAIQANELFHSSNQSMDISEAHSLVKQLNSVRQTVQKVKVNSDDIVAAYALGKAPESILPR